MIEYIKVTSIHKPVCI